MRFIFLAVCCILAIKGLQAEELEPPEVAKGLTWCVLLVKSPVKSLVEYHHLTRWLADVKGEWTDRQAPPLGCQMEIRRAADQARVARLPVLNRFDEMALRRIGQALDGQYLIALCVGDRRVSNVAELTIDAAYDPVTEKLLRLAPIEAGPGLPACFIGARGAGPAAGGPEFTTVDVYGPTLLIDGIEARPIALAGSFFPIPPGVQAERIVDLRGYRPPIDLAMPHKIQARFDKFTSDAVQLPAPAALGPAWDAATPKLPKIPEPRVQLTGAVTGMDGKPGLRYEVYLLGKDDAIYREVTDVNGEYAFVNIPPGSYKLGANPPAMGQPAMLIPGIEIEPDLPLRRDIRFTPLFLVAGQIYTPEGTFAAGVTIDLTVENPANGAVFQNTTTTDQFGYYGVGTPFSRVTYLGVNGKRVQGDMPIIEYNYVLRQDEK